MKNFLIVFMLFLVLVLASCQITTPQNPDHTPTSPTEKQTQETQAENTTTSADTQTTQEQTQEQTTFGPLHFPETQE
jgi:outer membrane biogenesis lipoprotein LolB